MCVCLCVCVCMYKIFDEEILKLQIEINNFIKRLNKRNSKLQVVGNASS